MTAALRLIRGGDCWWALFGSKVARLPLRAVLPVDAPLPGGGGRGLIDVERHRSLSAAAAAALSSAGFFDLPRPDNYAVTILTATACNLGCNYCFQNTAMAAAGSHAPPRIKDAAIDDEVVEATVGFVARQQAAANLSTVSVLLFGGEPLLNVAGCRRILSRLQGLGLIDAEIVTNAVLLNPRIARELFRVGLRRVQVTFDGARAFHDHVRVTRNGRPTYGTILRNVHAAAREVPQLAWNFRVNVSHHNIDGLGSLVDDLAGITRLARQVTFHLALIDDTGLGYENHVGYDEELASTFISTNRAAIQAGMRIPPSQPLSHCPYCSVTGGTHGAVINGDGSLYSCWENAGREDWIVGHVASGYADATTVAQRWVACDFDIKSHGSPEATRSFLDRVDAAALDAQHERKALRLASAS